MPAPEIAVAYVSIVPSLEGFQRQLRNQIVGPSADAGSEAGSSMGGKLKGALLAGAAGAALAAGAVIVKGLGDAIDQANITSKLQAQLGASGKDAAKYGKLAGKLYSSGVSDTFQDAADAIKSVMQSGIAPPGATVKQLESIATKASDVAGIFDQDLGGVTNAVSQMLRTGLAKNATEAFDLITKGFQSGADKGGDFLDTINEYGVQFQKAGLDGSTAIGLINQAIKGGARDSDIAADAIKEFSIRAIDGSKSTKDGFKALGLSAGDMAAKFGKGGKSATAALDTTLDRLRNIKDPIKRSAAATALFGTQSEDLGKALHAMDPSEAAKGLGKFAGSTEKAGKTIRSGPSHEIQVFQRRLQQGLVAVLGKYVVPAITSMAHAANTYLVPALKAIISAATDVFTFLRDAAPWLAPLAIAIGGITLALNAQAIATGLVTAVMSVYRAASLIGIAVTNGMAVAQGLLNAVMALNPFVLVAIALAALVAGIVIAYKRSETFRAIVQKCWEGIKFAVKLAWDNVLKPIFELFVWQIKLVGKIAMWLWEKAIKPAFGWIAGNVASTWKDKIKPAFEALKLGVKKVGEKFKDLYNGFIKPVAKWIADKVASTWKDKIKPAFEALKLGVKTVGESFKKAKDAIKTQWDKLQEIAKKPIRFIINTIYNKGIVPVWNRIAGAFGAPKLSTLNIKGFATGGILPGYTPGRDVHMAALSGGEAIMRPEWTRAMGPGYVNSMNAAARSGGVGGVRAAIAGGMPAFKDGGIFGWIGNAASTAAGWGSSAWEKAKEGASWLKDGIKSSAIAGMNSLVKPLIDKISGSSSLYKDMVTKVPRKMISSIVDFGGKADSKSAAAGMGGKGVKAALAWARTQNGKPYQWGGNGNPSWDCSGLMSAIESVIRGEKPHRRWATGSFSGRNAPAGWVEGMKAPFMIGVTNAGVGHTAGTLNGVNVESRGGGGVIVGSRARSYMDPLFTNRYGFAPSKKYDNGGWLQPGATQTVNKTGRPEAVLTSGQWSSLATLATSGGGGLQPGDRLVLVTGGGEFEAYVDRRADSRIKSTLVDPASLGRTL
jgi:phage-related minor tail protein